MQFEGVPLAHKLACEYSRPRRSRYYVRAAVFAGYP